MPRRGSLCHGPAIVMAGLSLIGCTGLLAVSGILRTQARRRGSRHPGHCRRRPTCYYDYAVDRRRHLRHRAWLVAAGRGATRAGSRDPGPGRAPSPSPRMPGPVGSVRAGTSHAGSPWGSVRAGGANCVLPPPRAGGSCPASAPSGVQPGPHAGVEDRHRTAPLGPGASRRASRGGALLGPTLPDADRRLRPPRASCRESRVSTGPRAGAPERHGAAQPGDRRRAPRAPQECARGPGRHPRIACGSESQPERHCTASPGTGEVAAGPSLSLQSGPGDNSP
jgi:hypothetical protein